MKLLFLFWLLTFSCFGQQKKLGKLPNELKEISGLELFNDTLLIGINDGGNEACLYLINFNGKIVRSIEVQNAQNVDWEDLAIDQKNELLYIGDFGNNNNSRKNLCVYEVSTKGLLNKSSVIAKKMPFNYPEQKNIPSAKKERYFDCEAMTFINGKLYLFTKSNSKPYRGTSKVYIFDFQEKSFMHLYDIELGNQGYFQNSITAADFHDGLLYISTYSYIYIFKPQNGSLEKVRKISYARLTQKESLVVLNAREILVADEKSPIFVGQNIYKITLKND